MSVVLAFSFLVNQLNEEVEAYQRRIAKLNQSPFNGVVLDGVTSNKHGRKQP
jgi:hypothetical protein